mmetsp:Transcript_53043/g.102468  ORF Transcript_53043/g.102468 Transcript_53043/m.102468 type:complete len:168 (-) Transcript_53043:270-773(-)
MDRALEEDPLDRSLADDGDGEGDDYDRDEDFDGDYQGNRAFVLKGPEELAMDYDVFGRYVESATKENGKPTYHGPKTEGARPSIAFCVAGDGKPTWWVYDASGGECFYAETEDDCPPKTGWKKQHGDEVPQVTLVPADEKDTPQGKSKSEAKKRDRSRSPRREACPW